MNSVKHFGHLKIFTNATSNFITVYTYDLPIIKVEFEDISINVSYFNYSSTTSTHYSKGIKKIIENPDVTNYIKTRLVVEFGKLREYITPLKNLSIYDRYEKIKNYARENSLVYGSSADGKWLRYLL